MLNDKFVLQKAFPAPSGLGNLLSLPVKSPPDITERREGIPVAPLGINVTAVLLALIVLLIVYSVMGWWAWT
jgi:hypothetical protein